VRVSWRGPYATMAPPPTRCIAVTAVASAAIDALKADRQPPA
jgi:hypothetical protein